jgi:hypothetical protein
MTSTVSTPRGSIVDQPRFDCRNAYVETLTPACPAFGFPMSLAACQRKVNELGAVGRQALA